MSNTGFFLTTINAAIKFKSLSEKAKKRMTVANPYQPLATNSSIQSNLLTSSSKDKTFVFQYNNLRK